MDTLKYLNLLGVPTIFAMCMALGRMMLSQAKKITILMTAQQAQMRQDLMDKYYKYIEQGEVSRRDLDDWEYAYQAYHALGANGVLDKRREELLELPTIDGVVR